MPWELFWGAHEMQWNTQGWTFPRNLSHVIREPTEWRPYSYKWPYYAAGMPYIPQGSIFIPSTDSWQLVTGYVIIAIASQHVLWMHSSLTTTQSAFLMVTHLHQGCFAKPRSKKWLPQYKWSKSWLVVNWTLKNKHTLMKVMPQWGMTLPFIKRDITRTHLRSSLSKIR